jgi:hypothetical protein
LLAFLSACICIARKCHEQQKDEQISQPSIWKRGAMSLLMIWPRQTMYIPRMLKWKMMQVTGTMGGACQRLIHERCNVSRRNRCTYYCWCCILFANNNLQMTKAESMGSFSLYDLSHRIQCKNELCWSSGPAVCMEQVPLNKQYMVVYSLDVNDILPDEWNKISPLGTIQMVLWSVKNDSSSSLTLNPPLEPSWTCYNDPPCQSTYFRIVLWVWSCRQGHCGKGRSKFCSDMINALRCTTSKEEAGEVMSMFDLLDPFFSGCQGRFYRSLIAIKESTHPQPHCNTMSVSIDNPKWSHHF